VLAAASVCVDQEDVDLLAVPVALRHDRSEDRVVAADDFELVGRLLVQLDRAVRVWVVGSRRCVRTIAFDD
jgi:hypothetical protein